MMPRSRSAWRMLIGSYLEIMPRMVSLHSKGNVEIEAPGHSILIRGKQLTLRRREVHLLTEDAVIVCKHELGRAAIVGSQRLVTIKNRKVLVENDPEGRLITGCPNIGATIKPCTATLAAQGGLL